MVERSYSALAHNKISFARSVNVTGFVRGTIDLFDGHFDRQNGRTIAFYSSKCSSLLIFNDDFDGHSDGDIMCQ